METYQVVSCPTSELSYTNKAILSPSATLAQFEHIAIRYPKKGEREFEAFVFSVTTDKAIKKNEIAFNVPGRKWAALMVNSVIEAAPYKFIHESQCLNMIGFTIDFANRSNAPKNISFDTEDMAKQFSLQFTNQAFTVGQLVGFVYRFSSSGKVVFELKVKQLEAVNMTKRTDDVATQSVEIGLTTANTIIMFEKAEGVEITLTGGLTNMDAAPNLFNQDWDFAKMGIGGLGEQFNKLFRRAFASRLLPPQFAQSMGEEHVRGILLYGPPGTGKTLIARQIGKMLLAREPKIVNGPEVLNKFVGESEANIRRLFAEAEEEQAKMGINSGLHLIIFDEIDSICKSRGSSASSSGVGDSVVNQLLSKIDGVDSLHNVLLIGMTNRRELIDEALLRPGRLEVQIEIGLPNKDGRLEILNIHTSKMRESGVLDPSVDLDQLAERCKNYTGAELAGLIRAARSLAVNRIVKPNATKMDKETFEKIKVTQADFLYAMEHDVKPALGASDNQLSALARPIIQWDPQIATIQSKLSKVVRSITKSAKANTPYFALVVGEPNTGLSTFAANMAVETNFPFVRIYSGESSDGEPESVKAQCLKKLFTDAARSELSCIILDDLEDILDYCNIGPRFSLTLRKILVSKRQLILPENHKMLIICTCRCEQSLTDLGVTKLFRSIVRVPSLTTAEQVQTVLMHHNEIGDNPFDVAQCKEIVETLASIPFKMGIKELENLIESAVEDEPLDRVRDFIEKMHALNLINKQSMLDRQFEFSRFG